MVSLVVGKRTAGAMHELVADFRRRSGGSRLPWLMTSDEYPAYAIRTAYGQVVHPPRTGWPGRPRKVVPELPAGLP